MESGKKEYTGFASYLIEGEITPEFIKDFEYWMRRYYKQWSLFTDWDDFSSICWEALLEKLPEFDPNVATIQTFCISRINNECWRIYMKNKGTRIENDIDDPVVNADIKASESNRCDIPDIYYFNLFSKHAYDLGVKVDIDRLYADYCENNLTDAVKAFGWWFMKEKLIEHN